MDAGYGADTGLRTELTALGLSYVAGIQPHTTVWLPGTGPLPPKVWSGRGRPTSRTRRDPEHQPVQVRALALSLDETAWQTITWREGSADWLTSRYARLRVRAAHRDERCKEPSAEEWLLIEWPQGKDAPTKYWFSALPEDMPIAELGSVEIWDSPTLDIVIQAWDGPICAERRPVGENATALPGEEVGPWPQR
jgi:SRSO17 transposase